MSITLFNWREQLQTDTTVKVKPWQPRTLTAEQWPPNYAAVYAWRNAELDHLRNNPDDLIAAEAHYSLHPADFIQHWMDTYNPRKENMRWMPFVFFKRQEEFINYVHELRADNESGLTEKCRDAGVTWLMCAYSVWSWRFRANDAIGWGSRKQMLVDTLGDPSSIFEKMRLIIDRLPDIWLPKGFTRGVHSTREKLINPENGAVITGESGDNIGRGGRTSMFVVDEAAFIERPEKIEASLGDNTNVRLDVSSVNGLGNVFHKRREAGKLWHPGAKIEKGFTRVFVFDWRDHPEKTPEWYKTRKAKYEREGMAHVFASEVDRDYAASIANALIPKEWLDACVDAHLVLKWAPPRQIWGAGLDVADGGIDRNAYSLLEENICRMVDEWGDRDPGVTARRVIAGLKHIKGIRVQYDCIGVGASVKSEYNRLIDDGVITADVIKLVPWNAGDSVQNPFDRIIPDDEHAPFNRDFFHNMKAQAWWSVRTRAYKTWRAVMFGEIYKPEEMLSIDSTIPLLQQLLKELAQPTQGKSGLLKTLVNKMPENTKSPNLADAFVMAYYPVDDDAGTAAVGTYGGGGTIGTGMRL